MAGMLTKGVVLLHDNARPHTAASRNTLIRIFKWEIFDHPSYSTDLAPSDYYLFTKLKVWLATQRFHTNKWLDNFAATFFDEGLQKLVSRYDSCLNVDETMWRSNAVMYVTVPYNKVLFCILYFFKKSIGC
jgi:hypothetical protein